MPVREVGARPGCISQTPCRGYAKGFENEPEVGHNKTSESLTWEIWFPTLNPVIYPRDLFFYPS